MPSSVIFEHPLKLNSFMLFKVFPYMRPDSIESLKFEPSSISDSK